MLNSENRMAAAAKSGWIQGEFTHKFCGGAKFWILSGGPSKSRVGKF